MKEQHWIWFALIVLAGAFFYAHYMVKGSSGEGIPGAVNETGFGTEEPHSILPMRKQLLHFRPFYVGH